MLEALFSGWIEAFHEWCSPINVALWIARLLLGECWLVRLASRHQRWRRSGVRPLNSLALTLVVGVLAAGGSGALTVWMYGRRETTTQAHPEPDATPRQGNEAELQLARNELTRARKQWQNLKQSLTRLKYSYRDLYQNAPVMYFSLDNQGKLVTFNDTLIQTLGYERKELHGKTYSVLLAPTKREKDAEIAENSPVVEGERASGARKTARHRYLVARFSFRPKGTSCAARALDLTEERIAWPMNCVRATRIERTNQRLRRMANSKRSRTLSRMT